MDAVLFVCTGNTCRSPSAAALLGQHLDDAAGIEVEVHSAGTIGAATRPPRALVQEGRSFGIDLAAHVPRKIELAMIEAADLVVGMTRQHLRQTVVVVPGSFPRTFTLREIVRRGLGTEARGATEDLATWLARLHHGRQRADLMGESPDDDIMDPMGGTRDDYRRMLTDVAALTGRLRDLGWPDATRPLAEEEAPSAPAHVDP